MPHFNIHSHNIRLQRCLSDAEWQNRQHSPMHTIRTTPIDTICWHIKHLIVSCRQHVEIEWSQQPCKSEYFYLVLFVRHQYELFAVTNYYSAAASAARSRDPRSHVQTTLTFPKHTPLPNHVFWQQLGGPCSINSKSAWKRCTGERDVVSKLRFAASLANVNGLVRLCHQHRRLRPR